MNSLMRWDPFNELEDFQSKLGNYFWRRATRDAKDKGGEFFAASQWAPAVDIIEDDKGYRFKAELPEIRREYIKVKLENGVLSISGERKFDKEEKGKTFHRIERQFGTFARSFSLPESIDPGRIEAEFAHGVLTVNAPKSDAVKPKLVEIKVS